MIQKLQYFIGSCTDPHRNLALEEYLTDTVGEDTCILYLWQNKHTVVIGRNQNAWQECRTTELEHDGGTLALSPAAARSTTIWGTSTSRSLCAHRTMTCAVSRA